MRCSTEQIYCLTADHPDAGAHTDDTLTGLVGHDELDIWGDVGEPGSDHERVANDLSAIDSQGAASGEGVASVDDLCGQLEIFVEDSPLGVDTGGQGVGRDRDGQLSGQSDGGPIDNDAFRLVATLNLGPVGSGASSIAQKGEGRINLLLLYPRILH